jgi:glycopeptide antibiotics resistance protein
VRDLLLNVLLFLPLGFALSRSGWPAGRTVAAGLALSALIETTQWLIPLGRFAILGDVLGNGAGAFLGAVAGSIAWRSITPSWPGFSVALIAWTSSCLLGAWSLGLAPLRGEVLHGQWSRKFGDTERFGGTVLAARMAGVAIHDWEVEDTTPLNLAFAEGYYDLELLLRGVPPSRAWAQVFGFTDGEATPNVEVALVGCRLRLQSKVNGTRLRLGTLLVQVDGGCVEDSSVVTPLRGTLTPREARLELAGGTGAGRVIRASLTPAGLWRLLMPFASLLRFQQLWEFGWLFGWAAIAGATMPRPVRGIPWLGLMAGGCMLLVELAIALSWGRATPTWAEVTGAAAGGLLGATVTGFTRRVSRDVNA